MKTTPEQTAELLAALNASDPEGGLVIEEDEETPF
jgi:hypothetical protein